jgi:dipeptidyl aminopeptidase/acylaminoacyl peptidase
MTDPTFDRTITAWLEERAQPHAPTGLAADIVQRTAQARPRQAWQIPERWFSMPTTIRLALVPRGLVLLLALWLILALTVAGAAVGGQLTFSRAILPAQVTGPAANGLIAFAREGDIWVVEPDGSDERALIVAPGVQAAPSWSRDGTRIAYRSAPTDAGPWDILVADADGSEPITVATGIIEEMGTFGADWSPDGSTLLFGARTVRSGDAPCTYSDLGEFCSSRIHTAATDGSTGAVAIGDPDLDARSPAWSPDGATIAFGGGDARTSVRLYLMGADGTDVRPISDSRGNGWSFVHQSWSPDGSEIVTQVGQWYWDIVLVAADGSAETMLTETPTDEVGPNFAVDGSIAWWGDRTDPCCLEVLEADGSRLALPGGWPVWSPDGSLIVTTSDATGETGDDSQLVVDRTGAILATIPSAATPSWQRLAP